MLTGEAASFWRENVAVVAVGNKLSNVRSFSILHSVQGLTSFNNDNSANFSGETKYNEGCLSFENM